MNELEKIVENILRKNRELLIKKRERAFGAIMGDVMRIVRGKIDGKIVNEVVREKLSAELAKLSS